jgi:hypothetical protein
MFSDAGLQDEGEDTKSGDRSAVEERFAVLAIQRGSRVVPMSMRFTPKPGDVAVVAVHEVEGEEARRRLDEIGWLPIEESDLDAEPRASQAVQAPAT